MEAVAVQPRLLLLERAVSAPSRSKPRQKDTLREPPSNTTERVCLENLTSNFLRKGASMRDPAASFIVKVLVVSCQSIWIPIHSPFR